MIRRRAGFAGVVLPSLFSVLLFACILAAAVPAFAQSIGGRVVDPQGHVVPGADVFLLVGRAVVTTVRAKSDGTFGPIDAAPGEYLIMASAPGLGSEPQIVAVKATGATSIELKLSIRAFRESLVVSASQVDVPLSRVTDSVTIIDRQEIEARQLRTVGDALRTVPGFGVVSNGGPGAVTSLFPRGGESDYTLVLVDGIPQNAFGGGFDAAHLPTVDVERIEVVRGPQSALHGGGAIGAIVHVVTRRGGPLSGQATFEGGGYGTSATAGAATGSSGSWTWGASADWFSTDGDTRFRENLGGNVENADYKRSAGSLSFGWSDRPDRSVRFDVRGGRNERGSPGAFGSDPAGMFFGLDTGSRTRNDTKGAGVSATLGPANGVRHLVNATWADYLGYFPSLDDTGAVLFDSQDESRRFTGRYQLDLPGRRVDFSTGLEFLRERADSTFIEGDVPEGFGFEDVPVLRSLLGIFLEARSSFGGKVFLNLGARVERIARNAMPANPNFFGPRPAFNEDVVWSANPKVSVAWFTGPSSGLGRGTTKIHGGVGTGIKPPTAFDIAFTDNPSLKPERSRSMDVGIEQTMAGARLVADATYFANNYDDLIVSVGDSFQSASRYRTDNIANASAKGLEFGLSWRAPSGIGARASWTWLDTEVLAVDGTTTSAPSPYQVGQPLVRRPEQRGSADLFWTGSRAQAYFSVNGRGQMLDVEPNRAGSVFDNPGYATLTLGGAFRVVRQIEIYGRVTNLANREYEEALGYPALGRAAFIGVRIAASR